MRAAIYARCSSENQSEKSIDDYVRVCKQYAAEHGMTVDEQHIYTDEAISGSLLMRPGLQAAERAAEVGEFEALVVEALRRRCDSVHFFLACGEKKWTRRPNAQRVRYSAPTSTVGASGVLITIFWPSARKWWRRRELHPRLRIESVSPLHA